MLAVVEHQEELLRAQELDDARLERHPRTRSDAERGGDHLDGLGFLVRHAELADPRAIAVVAEHAPCDLQREPGLADAAGAGDRHQRAGPDGAGDLDDRVLASDEGRDLQREVSGNDVEPGGRFDVVRQPGPRQLEDPLGPSEVAQPVLAQVDELQTVVERVAGQLLRGERDEDLSSARGVHQSCGAVHGGAVVVALAELSVTGVHADPNPEGPGHAPRFRGDRPLGTGRRAQSVVRTAEHRVHAVAPHLHDAPVAGQDRVPEERVVPGEGVLHRVGELFPDAWNPRDR